MRVSNIRLAVLAAVSGVALGGCAYGYDGYGDYGGLNVGLGYNSGYGYGYDPYGYGYGNYGYGYDPYGYGYGYGSPFGWYDGFYYPGSGIYVYDSYRRRHAWNDTQRSYWQNRLSRWRDHSRTNATTTATVRSYTPRENWSGFNRQRTRNYDTNRSSDTSRIRYWGRTSSSSSSSSDTTTQSDDRHGRGRGRHND